MQRKQMKKNELLYHTSLTGYYQNHKANHMLLRKWRKENAPSLLVGTEVSTATTEARWKSLRNLGIVEQGATPL